MNIQNFEFGIRFSHFVPDSSTGQTNPNYPTNCTVEACNLTGNGYGISFFSCLNCSAFGNYAADNTYGVYLYGSGNMLRNNRIEQNKYNFWDVDEGINEVDTSNMIDGKPIYYWINQHNTTVPEDAGMVVLKNCSGIRVQNLNLSGNGIGLSLYYTNDSEIVGNNLSDNCWRGIAVWWSHNNSIAGNQIANTANEGIEIYESQSNHISNNLITGNDGNGIYHRTTAVNELISNNNITANQGIGIGGDLNNSTVTDNYVFGNELGGVSVDSNCVVARNNITADKGTKVTGFQGIGLSFGSNCTITDNYISENNFGIWSYDGNGSLIESNTIAYNYHEGIRFQGPAENNQMYGNNFIENKKNGAQATVTNASGATM